MLSAISFSQDFVSIYQDYLPPEVAANRSYSEQVAASLKAYSDLNPELIYYYINYLNEKLKGTGRENNFSMKFPDIRKFYELKFNDWLMMVQKGIIAESADNRLTGLCINFLEDYYNEDLIPVTDPGLESNTDPNLRDFYIIKYYLQDDSLNYKFQEDYSVKRRIIEGKKLTGFAEMMDHPDNYTKADLNNLILSWYIIENNENLHAVNPSLIILNVLKHYYSNDNMFGRFKIGICYSFDANYMFMTDNSYGTTLYSPTQVENDFQMNSLSLSLRYRIILSDFFGSFNMLNLRISAGYGLINKSITGLKYGYWNTNVDGVSNRSEIFEFITNNIKLKNAEFVSADFSIPLLYFGEFVSLNLGGGFNLLFTNYELTYDYEYRKFESEFLGPKILSTETGSAENKKITSTNIKFYPEFSLNFYPGNTFTVYLMTTPRSASIEMGISL